MHSYETLAILVLALSTALPAISAPVQTSAALQSLNQRAPGLGSLASGLLNKLETTDTLGKVLGNGLLSGRSSGLASSGVKSLLNDTRRNFDENSALLPLTPAEHSRPYLGILPVISSPAAATFSVPGVHNRSLNVGSTSDNSLDTLTSKIYQNSFTNHILPGRSFRRDPSPFSLSDIEGFGEQFLKVLGLRSEPEDSLLNRDDALSESPDERQGPR